jgi:hypothetical protein
MIKDDTALLVNPDLKYDNIRDMFCADIVLSVYKDIVNAFKIIKTKSKTTRKTCMLQYRKFDPFKRAFKVRTQNKISDITGLPKGKVHFKNVNKFKFKASSDHVKNMYDIQLLEPVSDFYDKYNNEFITFDKYSGRKRYSFHHQDA